MRSFRIRTVARDLGVALVLLSMTLKLLFPTGFMPGHSFAQPIVICTGQGPMTTMMPMLPGASGNAEHGSGKKPHDSGDHACPFSGASAAPAAPAIASIMPAPAPIEVAVSPQVRTLAAPGRGMAAPPPPSQAPPFLHV